MSGEGKARQSNEREGKGKGGKPGLDETKRRKIIRGRATRQREEGWWEKRKDGREWNSGRTGA